MSKKPKNKWIVLITMPMQMGIVIFLFSYLGMWLDEQYPNPKEMYTKMVTLLGVFVALYNVIRQVKQLND